MRLATPFARTLALGLSTAVISVATGAAATAAPASVAPKLVAGLRVSSAAPLVGTAVQVDVHGTKVPKHDSIRSITISFGDHTKVAHLKTLKGSTRHAYAKVGTYTVTVTIVDARGKHAVRTKKVVVHAPATAPATAHTFPITIPGSATPSTLLGSILSADQLTAVATQLATPANVLSVLPVGYLKLLPASELVLPATGLPRMPGLVGLPASGDLVSLLTNLVGLPVVLPATGINPFQPLGQLPVVSFAQIGSVSALLGVPSTLVAKLPAIALLLLPGNLLRIGSPATTGLPVVVPSGLAPTDLISTLNLSSAVTNEVASLLSTPPSVLPTLPVAYLGLLSQIAPTTITNANLLPALPGFGGIDLNNLLSSLLAHGITGFPLALPQGLDLTQSLGSLPTTALTATQVSSLATLFGVVPATVAELPVVALNLLPSTLWSVVSGAGVTLSGLPITLPANLTPSTLVSGLSLTSTQLSSISSLLNIPTGTLSTLPVGFLKLLPTADLTGGTLPGLPGLATLPLLNDVLGMLLAGLPVTVPLGTNPSTLISALQSGVLSLVQLTTLSTYFGISPTTLAALPVRVLTLLPTGYVTGL